MIWFTIVMVGIITYSLLASWLFSWGVQTGEAEPSTGENSGGLMNTIARWVVLGLGRLTFGALHLFKKLGVDVATLDETLAAWTTWSDDIKGQLQSALETIQTLKDTDAAEDKAQADALTAEVEAKVQAAFDAATSTPTAPGTTDPVTTEPEAPVDETPVVPDPDEPTTPPAPFEPGPVSGDGGETVTDGTETAGQ